MNMKRLFALLGTLCIVAIATAQEISLNDVVFYRYYPKRISGLRPMADGESYSKFEHAADRTKIVRCSYTTGETQEVLFDSKEARGKSLEGISDYIIAPDGANILIETDATPIYRRSKTATYFIYNVRNKTLTPLSNGGAQEVPKFSPDGTMIS